MGIDWEEILGAEGDRLADAWQTNVNDAEDGWTDPPAGQPEDEPLDEDLPVFCDEEFPDDAPPQARKAPKGPAAPPPAGQPDDRTAVLGYDDEVAID